MRRCELRELVDFMGLGDVLRVEASSGSPKSGKSVSVSRKNVNSDDPPSAELEHLQRPRLVAVAGSLGLYCPNAGEPFAADVGNHAASRGSRCPGPNHHVKMSSRPASHMSNGGIDCVASSWISDVSASMS